MKKKIKNVTLITTITCVSLIGLSVYGTDSLFADKVSKEYMSWLHNVDDEKKLNEIFIPGTHNSGARYSFMDLSGKCQDISIKSQLILGVRYLDIRLKNDVGGLKIVHSFVDQKTSFKSVLSTCYSFLIDNPSEFIIMSIKEEEEGNSKLAFEERLKREINSKYFYHNENFPEKLQDVRGKIVLFSRYSSPTIGYDCYNGWKDSGEEKTNIFTLDNSNVHVQDYYEVPDIDAKKDDIVRCSTVNGYNINLNFTSGYLESAFPPNNAFDLAKEINPWLVTDLLKKQDIQSQVFVSDFITDTLAYSIIALNFDEENK